MTFPSPNRYAIAALALSAGGLATALVLQYVFAMSPCPFCITQRIALVATGIVAVFQLLLRQRFRFTTSLVGVAFSLAGFVLAAMHTYKMWFPVDSEVCGPGLGTLVDSLWLAQWIPSVFAPMGDCAEDAANLLGLPLPAYAAIIFIWLQMIFRKNAINAKAVLKAKRL